MEYKLKNGKNLIVRYPMIEDAEDIIEVISKADTESLFLAREEGEFKTTVEREQAIISSVLSSSYEAWFVAEYEGKIVGQCSVGLVRSYLRYRHRAEIAFVTLDEYCNLGIGGRMMEECLKWCREHNITQVELDVVTSNERALNMYKNFGFEIVGTMPNALHYKDDTYADEYYMVKTLDR